MQCIASIRSSSLRHLPTSSSRTCLLPLARVHSTTPFKTADPAVHKSASAAAEQEQEQEHEHEIPDPTNKPGDPVKNTPPVSSIPKLRSTEVGPTAEPTFQQKRRLSSRPSALDDVACVGVDGSVPFDKSKSREREKEEAADEYREYYKDHKPSPLSEVEFVDTRKPITRAVDGEKRDDLWGGEGTGYLVEDTVDEALARAEALFWAAKERGDPDLPHSRALQRKIRELYEMTDQKDGTFKSFS